jgi:hypothetical protein
LSIIAHMPHYTWPGAWAYFSDRLSLGWAGLGPIFPARPRFFVSGFGRPEARPEKCSGICPISWAKVFHCTGAPKLSPLLALMNFGARCDCRLLILGAHTHRTTLTNYSKREHTYTVKHLTIYNNASTPRSS